MLRLLLLPLFIFTLSMACMGQTFQYSRGWTNGKRAPPATPMLTNAHNLGLLDLYDMQDTPPNDRRLERCLVHLQHFVGNTLLHRSFANGLAYDGSRPDSEPLDQIRSLNIRTRQSSNSNPSINDNGVFGSNSNHRQSNELFDALSSVSSPGADSVEPGDYGKH